MIYAALDCHFIGIAKSTILMLSEEFPGSLRVMTFKALCFEAEEK